MSPTPGQIDMATLLRQKQLMSQMPQTTGQNDVQQQVAQQSPQAAMPNAGLDNFQSAMEPSEGTKGGQGGNIHALLTSGPLGLLAKKAMQKMSPSQPAKSPNPGSTPNQQPAQPATIGKNFMDQWKNQQIAKVGQAIGGLFHPNQPVSVPGQGPVPVQVNSPTTAPQGPPSGQLPPPPPTQPPVMPPAQGQIPPQLLQGMGGFGGGGGG